jgi:hypothetical protein
MHLLPSPILVKRPARKQGHLTLSYFIAKSMLSVYIFLACMYSSPLLDMNGHRIVCARMLSVAEIHPGPWLIMVIKWRVIPVDYGARPEVDVAPIDSMVSHKSTHVVHGAEALYHVEAAFAHLDPIVSPVIMMEYEKPYFYYWHWPS